MWTVWHLLRGFAVVLLVGAAMPGKVRGQPAATPEQAAPARVLGTQRVKLMDVTPRPMVVGETVILKFGIEVPPDASTPPNPASSLQVRIDDRQVAIRQVMIDTRENAPGHSFAGGSVTFTLERSALNEGWFRLNRSSEHTVSLYDTRTGIGDFARVTATESLSWWLFVVFLYAALIVAGFVTPYLVLRSSAYQHWLLRRSVRQERASQPRSAVRPGLLPGPRQVVRVPAVPDALVSALEEGQAVLVLGAGASARAGYPTGQALLLQLFQRLRGQLPEALARVVNDEHPETALRNLVLQVGGFGKCMDVLLSTVPREEVVLEIRSILAETRPDATFHAVLARLRWRGAISLTWDDFTETVFQHNRMADESWQVFTLDGTGDIAAALRGQARLFLRPLGDVGRPGALSLSIEEFRGNLARAPEFQRGLSLLLQTHTFLFLGVGPDTLQQFLQAVTPELTPGSPRHFVLVPEDGIEDLWSAALRQRGVTTLPYSDPTHAAVSEFALALAERTRNRVEPTRTLNQFRITRLELTNIGLFEKLVLGFHGAFPDPTTERSTGPALKSFAAKAPPAPDELPWTVVFGGNGCGKSTILRAICVVLAGKEADEAGRRLLRTGAKEGSIELYTELGPKPLTTQLVRDGSGVQVKSLQTTPVEGGLALVLGFPSLRGAPSPNPKGPKARVADNPMVPDLLSLANGALDDRMLSLKQWLVNVLVGSNSARNQRAQAIRELLEQIVRDVVPGDVQGFAPIEGEPYGIRVLTSAGEVPFDDLSLGMASIFNWLGVLIQRLYDVYPESRYPAQEPAIAVVDEIDAHLHPEWQRKLVDLVKRHFPKVQVIATSHSALLAGALRKEEICVLVQDGARVTPFPHEVDVFGQSSQTILTGPAFQLSFDRNLTAERKITQHMEILQKYSRTEGDEAQLSKLKDTIEPLGFAEAGTVTGAAQPTPAQGETSLTAEQEEALKKFFGQAVLSEAANQPERPT